VATLAVTGRADLTDAQWAVLEPLLPRGKKPGRPPDRTKRQLIDVADPGRGAVAGQRVAEVELRSAAAVPQTAVILIATWPYGVIRVQYRNARASAPLHVSSAR
jgi:hypothetical protein